MLFINATPSRHGDICVDLSASVIAFEDQTLTYASLEQAIRISYLELFIYYILVDILHRMYYVTPGLDSIVAL